MSKNKHNDEKSVTKVEPVCFPFRRVAYTFTHETCGDEFFRPLVFEALREWEAKIKKTSEEWRKGLNDSPINDAHDYLAKNGVLIQVTVAAETDEG